MMNIPQIVALCIYAMIAVFIAWPCLSYWLCVEKQWNALEAIVVGLVASLLWPISLAGMHFHVKNSNANRQK